MNKISATTPAYKTFVLNHEWHSSIIGFWYRKFDMSEILLGISVISVLVALRVITSKFSPNCNEEKY